MKVTGKEQRTQRRRSRWARKPRMISKSWAWRQHTFTTCDLTRPKTQGRLPLQAHWHGRQRELGMRSASESVAAPGQRLDDDGNHSDNTPLAVTTLTLFQTRRHILLECPRYANARCSTLRRMATVNDVLGTQEGIRALAKFVAKTEAFTKTGDAHVADPQDSVYETKWTQTRKRTRRNAGLGNRCIHEEC